MFDNQIDVKCVKRETGSIVFSSLKEASLLLNYCKNNKCPV